jgi:hypothetical protein
MKIVWWHFPDSQSCQCLPDVLGAGDGEIHALQTLTCNLTHESIRLVYSLPCRLGRNVK